jgi:hypothetical protein
MQVARFVADMADVPHACKPDVMLTYEVFTQERAAKMLYPINELRNLAKLQVGSSLK